jgi:hypothetical protein
MSGFIPHLKDRLGARLALSKAQGTVTNIPADESIILINWCRFHELDFSTGNRYVGFHFYRTSGGNNFITLRTTGDQVAVEVWKNGTLQTLLASVPVVLERDHMIAIVLDRDNTKAHIWLDNDWLKTDITITQDPDLTANNLVRCHLDSVGTPIITSWRGSAISIQSGKMLSADALAPLLSVMWNSDELWAWQLVNVVGSFYSDYRPGEGLYGSGTVTDTGTNEDDLAWQGGVTTEDVRVRAPVPIATPDNTFFTLQPGYDAVLGATDYDLDTSDPIVVRWIRGSLTVVGGTQNYIRITSDSDNALAVEPRLSDIPGMDARGNGGSWQTMPFAGDQFWDLHDSWFIVDGTEVKIFMGGQHVDTLTLTGPFEATSLTSVRFDGHGGFVRAALWNPPTIPSSLEQEIRDCCMNLEKDPASLKEWRKINYSLDVLHLATPTSTNVANDWGPGTLVISDDRDVACIPAVEGADRLVA